ncbi:activin receptor type-2A-like [Clytia hemisphaerica]|uniref:Serine/threonine-protein kinase receptor n=1 Tax=Clytia hemisphaerica TaxID=252671 RepID=A0A7M6DNI7_9CNID
MSQCLSLNEKKSQKCFEDLNCFETCGKNQVCTIFYRNMTGELQPGFAGCWEKEGKGFCNPDHLTHIDCHLRHKGKHNGIDSFMCCCTGNRCNKNLIQNATLMTPTPSTSTETTLMTELPKHPESKTLQYSIPPVICSIFVVIALLYFWKRHKQRIPSGHPLIPYQPPTPIITKPLQWDRVVNVGQFGCVWKATYNNNEVAVKIIQAHEKSSWITEKTMYQYNLVHDNILKFYSAEKRLSDSNMIQYWIVTQYHANGSLADYLSSNTLDWTLMLQLAISMTQGIAYLHEEIMTETIRKPIIAHRDIKSRNVLVRDNLTCCISDFGSACQFSENTDKEEIKGQVGTKRYMAPEVLEGAVAFQTESYKSIDCYSLSLILWELLSRCDTGQVPAEPVYQLPFEAEVGTNPTLEELRACVSEQGMRPKLKAGWTRDPKVTELCNTIEEGWDKEGDARLSAPGVLQRLKELQLAAEGGEVNPTQATRINIPPYGDGDSTLGGNSTGVSFLSGSTSSCGKEPLIVDLS